MKDGRVSENTGTHGTLGDWKQEAGPLKPYLIDKSVSEIMVNRWDTIFIERNGLIEIADYKFPNADALNRFAASLAAILGKELNRKTPFLDARLPDGSRLNIVIPPIALDSPTITIRKPSVINFNHQSLMAAGTLDEKSIYFLNFAVNSRQNLLISGGTGSGKTTLMSVLTTFINPKERIITIEDTAEIQIHLKNVARMETRPPIGQEPGIYADQLLKNALRMRPDRIIVGECRGAEAFDMLMAMNTGHNGSMTTMHANSAGDALRRLESMVLRAGIEAPLTMVQNDIANTIKIVVQISRLTDGKRRVTEIVEVLGRQDEKYNVQSIFKYSEKEGSLQSTGYWPGFISENANLKAKFPAQFFQPNYKPKLAA
jgi:pilus assembly protein CpaF